MLGRLFWSVIAIFFPWLIILLDDNPGGALVALVMQVTIIGWIPAAIWALQVVRENSQTKTKEEEKDTTK